ncbi:MAG: lysine-sensitive aspartokinase 3 [Gemmatimonadetes bacterium]|nr:MAG: lysine-sensitive aspartokinase 3 [Gemmatimonadota bacterium]
MTYPIVVKFGGTSVQDAAAFERAGGIVRSHGGARPVVVVSALSGMTDALLAAAATAHDGTAALDSLEPHFERHRQVARQLLSTAAATTWCTELDRSIHSLTDLAGRITRGADTGPALHDEFAAHGEHLAATLCSAVLEARGFRARYVDARRCIVTTDEHPAAVPLLAETRTRTQGELGPLLDVGEIPVLGGYVAAAANGVTTTLGRGGSDYSAALIGASLSASEIQIWTDVSGVLTADPRIVRAARTIPRLSYAEAAELAYFGAKVLHPRTIQPAMDAGIPVRICNSHAPDDPGTLVTAEADIWPETVKAIAHKRGITIVQVASARMLGAYGFLRALFDVFERHHTAVDVVATSEVSVSLSVEETAALPQIVAELRRLGEVRVEPRRAVVCIVGEGLRATPGIAARVFDAIRDINVLLVSQGASQVNLTFVVNDAEVGEVVTRLHAALLERDRAPTSVAIPAARPRAGAPLDVCQLARQLIDIPSISGEEAAIARFLAEYLTDLGYRVALADAAPGRPNLFATTGAAPRVVLCTHLDTVPPFIGSHDDGEFIAGRGACDSKGILAAQIVAAERLRADGFAELGLLYVVDEEMGSLGARAANAHPRARECRYVIVGEPTENKLAVGCKGSLRATLRCSGTGGHSAYPERGTSAIDGLLHILTDLRAATWPVDDFFGATTFNIGIIGGGTRTNVLASEAKADLHFRLVTDVDVVRHQLEDIVADRAEIEYLSVTPPMRLTGMPGFQQCVVGFTTDVAHLGHWGAPLLLGPGSMLEAHTAHERIAKAELAGGVDLYVELVRSLIAGHVSTAANARTGKLPMPFTRGGTA